MKVIRYTIFDSIPDGNGADKRTAQVSEILEKAGIESIFVKQDESVMVSLKEVLLRFIPVLKRIVKVVPISEFAGTRKVFKAVKEYIRTEETLISALKSDAELVLWECTRSNNFFVPLIARKYKKRIIALPHNIESLVLLQESSVSKKESPKWFNEEINYLSHCDKIFCISREETLFLKLFGMNAYYLPYFPTEDIEAYFRKVKEKRSSKIQSKIKKLLMIGSANNQPTRLGMIDRIRFFSNNKSNEIYLTIAGFYTQTLAEDVKIPKNIRISGTLDSYQLEKELVDTDAILIHQCASTGALTRISEMLLAGIPIILNFESARNYYNHEGLYVYQNDKELVELLTNSKIKNVPIISRPVKEEQFFTETLKKMAN